MALGRTIVDQLGLTSHDDVIERWMAHHLAELISTADQATGDDKSRAEAQAVDTILKLWAHRRVLPEPVDPLAGLRLAIDVLGRMSPEADPWARNRLRPNPPVLAFEPVLSEIFQTLSRTMMAGLLLTLNARLRPIIASESAMLGPEEDRLLEEINVWMDYVRQQPSAPRVRIKYVAGSPDTDTASEGEGEDALAAPDEDLDDIELVEDDIDDNGPKANTAGADRSNAEDERLRTAVVENLRAARDQVDRLIDSWERVSRAEDEDDEDDD